MSAPDILVRDITKTINGTEILKGVSFDVGRGEAVAVVGPTGCGKTTTLRIVGGFESADTGAVELLGEDAADIPPNRRPTRTVFQDFGLFPNMTVFGNVSYGLKVRRMGRAEIVRRVGEALEMVRLGGYQKKSIRGLSGGERQRVAFARVLVTEPKIVLLDEPFSAIDEALRSAMEVELRHLQQRLGLTFVLVTHNQGEAMALADRLVVMSKGNVAQVGRGADIYRAPRTRFVANFLGEANLLPLTGVAVDGQTTRGSDRDGAVVVAGAHRGSTARTLCIRPEAIEVGPAAATLANRRQASVVDAVFRGPIRKLFVRTAGGQDYSITSLSSAALAPAPGEMVEIGWSETNASLLDDDQ